MDFWGPNGLFLSTVQKLLWGLLIYTNNFCFLNFALFLLYHVVEFLWWVVVVGGFQRLRSLNRTTVLVVLLMCLWLLLGCDNSPCGNLLEKCIKKYRLGCIRQVAIWIYLVVNSLRSEASDSCIRLIYIWNLETSF